MVLLTTTASRTMKMINNSVLKLTSKPAVWLSVLLLLCGDVESNPGPKPAREPKPDKAKIMADKVDAHDAKLEELEALVKSQAELIEALTAKQVDLVTQLEEKQVELRTSMEANKVEADTSIGQLKVALESDLKRTSSNLEIKIDEQKTAQAAETKELRDEIRGLRNKVESGVDNLGSQSADTTTKVKEMEMALEDIQEKLWELDKSWKNNLVFYGVKSDAGVDEHPSVTEAKIRDVIKLNLQLTREVPIIKVRRTPNGPTVRGSKPITVCFEKWADKDEILRKANLLRGSNIYVSEDFSKKVRDQRSELQKFLKLIRRKRPASKFSLHFDKLFVDNEIYMFNEATGQVEQVTATITSASPVPGERPILDFAGTPNSGGHPNSASGNINRMRKKSSGKKRLEKSYSTESSLNHLVPNSPVHPSRSAKQSYDSDTEPESQTGSPVKTRKNIVNKMNGGKVGGGSSPKKGVSSASTKPPPPKVEKEEELHDHNGEDTEKEADDETTTIDVNLDDIVADYKKINTYDGPLRKSEPDIPETIPE